MDDYLSKPLDRARLAECLEKHLGSHASLGAADAPGSPEELTFELAPDPVDWPALLDSIDGDKQMACELVELFIASGDETLAAIVNALDKGDLLVVREQAHSLKGASANLRAVGTSAAAARLEAAARAGSGQEVADLTVELGEEIARAVDFLRSKVA